MDWLRKVLGLDFDGHSGEPPSGNGASSFHLWWQMQPAVPLREVSVSFEILEPPAVSRLYFWALQVTFGGAAPGEGAHLGIQHHPGFPVSGAANWGGYASAADGGGLLKGSPSPLPSFRQDINTRDFAWEPQRKYRFHIGRSQDRAPTGYVAWEGRIQDTQTGQWWKIRDLYTRGTYLTTPLMWTEAFARCEHPSVAVRWSDPVAVRAEGTEQVPTGFRVAYQERSRGGCANTSVEVTPGGIVQRTNTTRTVAPNTIVRLA